MPNNWVLGQTIGLGVDEKDHVWIIHRGNDPARQTWTAPSSAVVAAPARRASASAATRRRRCSSSIRPATSSATGAARRSGYDWPESNHGIVVDHKGIVWIGGNGGHDAHILKFTRDGKFVAQYGKAGARRDPKSPPTSRPTSPTAWTWTTSAASPRSSSTRRPTKAYVADGYFNHRVAVIDMDSGKIKRYLGRLRQAADDDDLGRYIPAQPPAQQFRNPVHCAEVSNDGMVYVCDRPNDRVQVFTKEGKFVKEALRRDRTRWPTARCGTSPSRRIRSRSTSTWPTA